MPVSTPLDARDVKIAFRRELTKSNLLSALGKQKFRRLFRFISDRRRISPDLESGEAVSDLPTFHLQPPLEIPPGKSVD